MLPATFVRGITGSGGETAMRITAWGWEAAWYSILPFFFVPGHADDPSIWLWALASGTSNIGSLWCGLPTTPTTTRSKIFEARVITSTCPFVTGS